VLEEMMDVYVKVFEMLDAIAEEEPWKKQMCELEKKRITDIEGAANC
jgi:hypothetical protein